MTAITIVMTTWLPPNRDGMRRLEIIQETLSSWQENLQSNDDIYLHIADDGSSERMLHALESIVSEQWVRHGTTYSQQNRKGVGASLNNGLEQAFRHTDIVLYAVDDWKLVKTLNLNPWIVLLRDDDILAGIRFFPHPDLTGTIKYVDPGVYMVDIDRHHFAFATRPSLWHKRMFEAYGYFDEGVSAYECEQFYNERYCKLIGPKLIMALPDEWKHLGGVELGDITP